MSAVMEEEIKRWTAQRKSALGSTPCRKSVLAASRPLRASASETDLRIHPQGQQDLPAPKAVFQPPVAEAGWAHVQVQAAPLQRACRASRP